MQITVKHTPYFATEHGSGIYNVMAKKLSVKQEPAWSHQCGTVPPLVGLHRLGLVLCWHKHTGSGSLDSISALLCIVPCRHMGLFRFHEKHCTVWSRHDSGFPELLNCIFLSWSSVQNVHKLYMISNYSTVCGHATWSSEFCSSYLFHFHVFLCFSALLQLPPTLRFTKRSNLGGSC